jgi:hypothetical protein
LADAKATSDRLQGELERATSERDRKVKDRDSDILAALLAVEQPDPETELKSADSAV